jgi:Ni/Fe-hydrogenase subunit HybB-like protein
MNGVEGYMYPNEIRLYWSVLIVLYPYITGLVAGAFILASLERIFHVKAIAPTYRLALLTALAFLIVAPLPLTLHLGHPLRAPEMYFTPHATSAMAMFGYVYLWYLMAVLVFEIWLDYRRDIVLLSQSTTGWKRLLYSVMTLGSTNISERSLAIDERVGWIVTLVGIPSAFILHGYVGFIFGSLKANPWWNSPLMPVVFIFSAMVSGIAAVMLIYMLTTKFRKLKIDMPCVDTIAKFLFYIFIIDFSLEMLDLIHRIYEADESFRSISFMVHTKLYFSQIVLQIYIGTFVPLFLLALVQVTKLPAIVRRRIYFVSGCLVQVAVLSMRWNVVIGGQLFSKSFLGYTTYKMSLATREGSLMAIALLILPMVILWVLVNLLPPWPDEESGKVHAESMPMS